MAFGIGTNTQKADAGPIKGKQREIGCYCWFTNKGKMITTIEFNCTITILEQPINVWLIYYKAENRWTLVYRRK